MKNAISVILLIVYILPFIYFGWGMVNIDIFLSTENIELRGNMRVITASIMGAGIIGYFLHLFLNKTVEKNAKLKWVIVFLLLNYLIFPVYWYKHVFKTKNT